MDIIKINKLTKYYGKVKGIENLDLTIKEGEIFGFIGPNGAGKSTTIRTLLSLIFPTSGSATIFGKDTVKYYKEILQDVGYLPSEVFYYDNMRAGELLNYAASFYQGDFSARILELATILDLDLNKKIEDLSYGNRKKVGIVQGLLHGPKLIILDEPTGGLDPLMQQKFFDIIEEERNNGATVLFSSHILSEVQRICDRVAIIKDGHIIKVENVKDMMKNNYKKVTLDFNSKQEAKSFKIAGSANLKVTGEIISFVYNGKVNDLIKKISTYDLNDVQITEPDLEEIFMHYYGQGE